MNIFIILILIVIVLLLLLFCGILWGFVAIAFFGSVVGLVIYLLKRFAGG